MQTRNGIEAEDICRARELNARAWALRWRAPRHSAQAARAVLARLEAARCPVAAGQRGLAHRTLAWHCKWLGEFNSARRHCAAAEPLLTAAGEGPALADVLAVLGVIHYSLGLYDTAAGLVERGMEANGPDGQVETRFDLLTTLATIHRYSHDIGRAREILRALVVEGREAGLWQEVARVEHNLARMELAAGNGPGVFAHASEALRLCRETRNRVVLRYALEVMGSAFLATGAPERAHAVLDEGLAQAHVAGDRRSICQVLEQRALAHMAGGNDAGAARDFEQGLEVALRLDYAIWTRRFHRGLADLHEAAGRYREALAAEKACAEIERRMTEDAAERRFAEIRARLDLREATEAMEAERRRNAELELARDAADQANRMKTTFLANVSHELRTPLNGMLGMAQLLERTELGSHQRDCVRTILASGDALNALIGDLLDMTRIEAGMVSLVSGPVEPLQLLARVADTLRGPAELKGLRIQVIAENLPTGPFQGDAGRIFQVLLNLAGNAVKFTDTGAVTLSAVERPGAGLVFRVRDTGPGIAPEDHRRIFERFTQVDQTTTRRFGGSGLGLAICRDLVRLMEGEITVDSALGAGAVFSVYLPLPRLGPAAAPLREVPAVPAAGSAPPMVLVVEDDPGNARFLGEAIRHLGYRGEAVGSGREALERIAAGGVDVVITDLHMPRMSGLDLLRRLRATEGADLPVIVVSADTAATTRAMAESMGAHGFLEKPVVLATLQAMLVTALAGRRAAATDLARRAHC